MKYNREEFVTLMAKMEDKYRPASKIADSFNDIFGNGIGYDFLESVGFNWYLDYLTETLEKMFAEEIQNDSDIFSWFIFENDFGAQNYCWEQTQIGSAGELYDYMMYKE